MSAASPFSTPFEADTSIRSLREIWLLLVLMGLALIVVGMMAIGASLVTTLATVAVFGLMLLVGAILQTFAAIWGRRWRGFFLHLLAGILYFVAGIFLIENPVAAALSLTLLIAACLLVGGIFRIVLSLAERFEGRGWMLLNGVVSATLGIAI